MGLLLSLSLSKQLENYYSCVLLKVGYRLYITFLIHICILTNSNFIDIQTKILVQPH